MDDIPPYAQTLAMALRNETRLLALDSMATHQGIMERSQQSTRPRAHPSSIGKAPELNEPKIPFKYHFTDTADIDHYLYLRQKSPPFLERRSKLMNITTNFPQSKPKLQQSS